MDVFSYKPVRKTEGNGFVNSGVFPSDTELYSGGSKISLKGSANSKGGVNLSFGQN